MIKWQQEQIQTKLALLDNPNLKNQHFNQNTIQNEKQNFNNFLEMKSELELEGDDFQKCGLLKKQAKQKSYCEDKYLTNQGEKAVVACFTNFCNVCCKDLGATCVKFCYTSHIDKECKDNDPEDVFIKVCASQRLVDSMKPFCDKFYKNSQVQLKMCQNSFCNDCCSSELKVTDLKDVEIQKCRNLCMKKIKESNATVDSLLHHKNRTKVNPSQEQQSSIQIQQPSMNSQQIQQSPIKEHTQQMDSAVEYKYSQCAVNDLQNAQNAFCSQKVNPSDQDYRVQNKENCNSYYCPLCCKNFYKGMEILNCQKECHTALNNYQKTKLARDNTNQNNKQDVIQLQTTNGVSSLQNAKTNANANSNALQELINSVPQQISALNLGQPQQQQQLQTQQIQSTFNEEELSFMKTICLAFKSLDCSYDICNQMCTQQFSSSEQSKQQECTGSCVINIQKAKDNQQAKDILQYFLSKGVSNNQQMLNNIKSPNTQDLSIDQQIQSTKSQIQSLHTQILQMQDNVLNLQKLKFKQLQSQIN